MKRCFRSVRNHVSWLRSEFTGNTAGDMEKLSNAFRQGQFYMCLEHFGRSEGLSTCKLGQIEQAAQAIPWVPTSRWKTVLTL